MNLYFLSGIVTFAIPTLISSTISGIATFGLCVTSVVGSFGFRKIKEIKRIKVKLKKQVPSAGLTSYLHSRSNLIYSETMVKTRRLLV